MRDQTPPRIEIRSEIGALREVVVHRPGPEIARMTQHELERLLFDDLLSPTETGREHDVMTDVLRGAGARVHEITDLLAHALERAPSGPREALVTRVTAAAGALHIAPILAERSPAELARALVAGVFWHELDAAPATLSRLRARLFDPTDMALRPIPNLMFMRDPSFVIDDQVVVSRMARDARAREALLVGFALRWGLPGGLGPRMTPLVDDGHPGRRHCTVEGGDVLMLGPEFIMVGSSERTSPLGIERLAHDVLFPNQPALERIYAVMMPAARSIMHLDTLLTQVDRDLFLGHAPLVAGHTGHLGHHPLRVACLQRGKPPELIDGTLLDVLRDELGLAVELVPCGGDDPVRQEREQWTDGANAVCLAPGRVLLYSRNVGTIEALGERGFVEIRLSAVQSADERAALIAEGMTHERAIFSFTGSELCRARGGGRCLTMPLQRAAVD